MSIANRDHQHPSIQMDYANIGKERDIPHLVACLIAEFFELTCIPEQVISHSSPCAITFQSLPGQRASK